MPKRVAWTSGVVVLAFAIGALAACSGDDTESLTAPDAYLDVSIREDVTAGGETSGLANGSDASPGGWDATVDVDRGDAGADARLGSDAGAAHPDTGSTARDAASRDAGADGGLDAADAAFDRGDAGPDGGLDAADAAFDRGDASMPTDASFQCPQPTVLPNGGTVARGTNVTIVPPAFPGNSMIFYTTDGTVPTQASTTYGAPFPIWRNETIIALAHWPMGFCPDSLAAQTFTVPTTIAVINASPSLHPIRLCMVPADPSLVGDVPFPSDTPMPESNYAGIPAGGAVWLDAQHVASLMTQDTTIYAMDARTLATMSDPDTSCRLLIPGCEQGSAFCWPLGTLLATGAISAGQLNVVAIGGCLGADPKAGPRRCGPLWNSLTGNLHLDVLSIVDSSPPPDGGTLSIQAAQLSPGLASALSDAGRAVVTYAWGLDGDGGANIASLVAEGEVSPTAVSVPAPTRLSGFGELGFAVDVQGVDDGSAGRLWMSLAQSQELVDLRTTPAAYYGVFGTYVVAVVGDPDATHAYDTLADAGYDGTGLHLLVLPSTAP